MQPRVRVDHVHQSQRQLTHHVHLGGEQRVDQGVLVVEVQQMDLVHVGRFAPVVRVALEHGHLAGLERAEGERPGAHGLGGIVVRGHDPHRVLGDRVHQGRVRFLQLEPHRPLVHRHGALEQSESGGTGLGIVGVRDPLERGHHILGREGPAVVEAHALPQPEYPLAPALAGLCGFRQAGDQLVVGVELVEPVVQPHHAPAVRGDHGCMGVQAVGRAAPGHSDPQGASALRFTRGPGRPRSGLASTAAPGEGQRRRSGAQAHESPPGHRRAQHGTHGGGRCDLVRGRSAAGGSPTFGWLDRGWQWIHGSSQAAWSRAWSSCAEAATQSGGRGGRGSPRRECRAAQSQLRDLAEARGHHAVSPHGRLSGEPTTVDLGLRTACTAAAGGLPSPAQTATGGKDEGRALAHAVHVASLVSSERASRRTGCSPARSWPRSRSTLPCWGTERVKRGTLTERVERSSPCTGGGHGSQRPGASTPHGTAPASALGISPGDQAATVPGGGARPGAGPRDR